MDGQIILSSSTQPDNPILNSPSAVIYDPGIQCRNFLQQLALFVSIAILCHEEKELTELLQKTRDGQLLLLLILPEKDHTATRAFLDQHIPNRAKLHSLYLIFSNGEQFHGRWINTPSMLPLRWCRSCTAQLAQYIRDFYQAVCNVMIQFYHDEMTRAQDAVDLDHDNASKGLVRLYAREWQQFSRLGAQFF